MKIQKKYVIVLASSIIVAGFLIYRNYQAEQKNNKIEKIQVARGDLAEEVTISGKIKAEEDITLHFQTSGKVSWIGVRECMKNVHLRGAIYLTPRVCLTYVALLNDR